MTSERFVMAGCSHGDMIDPVAEKALLSFIKDFKPSIRVHLGDGFDFRALRRGASDDEKADSLKLDWEMGSDFLRRYFDGGKQNHYLEGNHCGWRLRRLAESATNAVKREYAEDAIKRFEQLIKGKCRARMLPYNTRTGILRLGHLKAVHGYFSGKNAGARHAAVYGSVIYAHTHTIETCPVESDTGPAEARGIGCICKVDMPYNDRQPNKLRHNNGWVYGWLFHDGTYQIFQAIRIKDHFYAAQDIKEY